MATLYVTDQGAYVKVQHRQFQVWHQQVMKYSVPVNRVTHLVLFSRSNLSYGAVNLCLQNKIPVLYLSENGLYFGYLTHSAPSKMEYLRHQVECSDDPEFVLRNAVAIVQAKLHNSRILLMRLNRRRRVQAARDAFESLKDVMNKVHTAETVASLLGYEGQGSKLYFQGWGALIKEPFVFTHRNRRPPKDPVNSLLSLGYTLLSQNIHAIVEVMGLHTHLGNLHTPGDNHPALVSDLMEEFRALVVDSVVAYALNSKTFKLDDFTLPDERGGVYLKPAALKRFLHVWEERLLLEVMHLHTRTKVSYRRCFELQVWEYVQCITGEQETYRPMKWKK